MDRVLEIDGIELIGINNRDLGTLFPFKPSICTIMFCLVVHGLLIVIRVSMPGK